MCGRVCVDRRVYGLKIEVPAGWEPTEKLDPQDLPDPCMGPLPLVEVMLPWLAWLGFGWDWGLVLAFGEVSEFGAGLSGPPGLAAPDSSPFRSAFHFAMMLSIT